MLYLQKEIAVKLKKYLTMSNITKEDFKAYVDVQESGVTNMFDVRTVSNISGLDRDQCITIMSNYSELNEKYGD